MGTSALIGTYNKDGSVTASYCHYDGYVEGVGRTLQEHYNSQYDADIVAKGGYMSALYEDYLVTRQEAVHNEKANTYKDVDTYLVRGSAYSGADYLYLWDGYAWFFAPTYPRAAENKAFEEVQMNLKKV